MAALTPRQKELVERIQTDRKLNPKGRSPKQWLEEKRTGLRLTDLTKLLQTSTATLYALFDFYSITSPKREDRPARTGYINKDLEETRELLSLARQRGKRAQAARQKLLKKGIRYYTAEEAQDLGID